MKQIVDLQKDHRFGPSTIPVLSFGIQPAKQWADEDAKRGVTWPTMSDPAARVARAYGVMRWAMGDMPGHTFVLVGPDGTIRWVRDYGAPANGGLMYVKVDDLWRELSPHLKGG